MSSCACEGANCQLSTNFKTLNDAGNTELLTSSSTTGSAGFFAAKLSPLPANAPSWLSHVPQSAKPYLMLARLDKPIGTLLLYYPCTWGLLMSSYALHSAPLVPLWYLTLFGTGAFIMRGAGCTINDLWDRDLDRAVARTRDRPLASGAITPGQAIAFLGGQLTLGLGVLTQLNWYSIWLGASSLSLVGIYPLMKRVTYWPQFVLGLAFNWGTLLGWSALAGVVNWQVCLPLYAGSICWTIVYDTIYAHQDKADDGPAGIRSTALLFGDQTRPILTGFSAASMSLLSYAGYLNGQGLLFHAAVGASAVEMLRIVWSTDYESRESCWKGFVGCGRAGLLVSLGLGVDYGISKFSE
ncbi:4-hydroxybenzoate polyprenyl transferase [Clavulina sp. PMI_390]|nr:4-hydroxybenzoate polyprenyl transferase [Clavulina sp. PMI_390]